MRQDLKLHEMNLTEAMKKGFTPVQWAQSIIEYEKKMVKHPNSLSQMSDSKPCTTCLGRETIIRFLRQKILEEDV